MTAGFLVAGFSFVRHTENGSFSKEDRMSKPGEGGTRMVTCARYDFEKVYTAFVALIDALTVRNGGVSTVGTRRHGTETFDWPKPGKASCARFWEVARSIYDVVDEPLVHRFGDLTLEAYLLGKDWCKMDTSTGAITTASGQSSDRLGSMPLVVICGKLLGPRSYEFPTPREIARVEEVVSRDLAGYGLTFTKSEISTIPGYDISLQTGNIAFQHKVFGNGIAPQRVRCVDVNGRELPRPD